MQRYRDDSTGTATKALLRAMGTVIKRAEDLGEDEVVDVVVTLKTNLARQASLRRERERLRAKVKRRARRRTATKASLLSKKRALLGKPTLYLVGDTPPKP